MPMRDPSQRPLPKSACTPFESPIDAISAAESDATESPSTRWLHTLVAGKAGQLRTFGEVGAAEAASVAVTAATASSFTVGAVAPPSRPRGPCRRDVPAGG